MCSFLCTFKSKKEKCGSTLILCVLHLLNLFFKVIWLLCTDVLCQYSSGWPLLNWKVDQSTNYISATQTMLTLKVSRQKILLLEP